MTDQIAQDAEGVKTADDVRKVALELSRALPKATVEAIAEVAVGFDDFTGKRRSIADLAPAELTRAWWVCTNALGGESDNAANGKKVDAILDRISKGDAILDQISKGEADVGRPQVELKASFLPQAIAKVERLLLSEARSIRNVQDRIFQRDGKLVRLSRNLLPAGEKFDDEYRENNALLIVEVKPKWLANRLDRTIQFIGAPVGNPDKQKKNAKGKVKRVPKNASAELVSRIIEDSSRWRHPYLFGTIEAPTLRADGTVLDRPGYDKLSGLFFDPGVAEFPPIPDEPSREDGLAAIKSIEALLVDFPFQDAEGYDGVSKAVALAAILTGPVRRTLDIAPAFAVTANEAETGKTELSKVIAGVTLGREVSGQPFSDSEEERRKAIGANLRAGRQILFFDNADNVTIEGDFMEKMITLPSVTDRILGMTDDYTAPTNCLVLFNGNHITIGGAMTTRVLLTRIVTDMPLALRAFAYPELFKHVIENRPQLIWAVLTALRAWLVNGERDPKRATNRFQQWDSLIAQALIWYGYADPMRGGDELREVDPVKEAKREVVRQWAAAYGDTTITAAELLKHHAVAGAICNARKLRSHELTAVHVAKYVATIEGARLDIDWHVVRQAKVKGEAARWHLEYIGEGEAPAAETAAEMDTTAVEDFGEDA